MKSVDFFTLSRSVQDRFVGAVTKRFVPAPVAQRLGGRKTAPMYFGIAGAAALGMLVVFVVGFGKLDSALSIHGTVGLVVQIVLASVTAFGVTHALADILRIQGLPYPPGIYVFPMCVIDAREPMFRVYAMLDLKSVSVVGREIKLSFADGEFSLPVTEGNSPEAIRDQLTGGNDHLREAISLEDSAELVTLDPLHQPRFSSPVGPREAHKLSVPSWGKMAPVIGIGVGLVLGGGLWLFRNSASDNRMFAQAEANGDVASYKKYLERGKRHADLITEVNLPRAELKEAEAQGADALIQFREAHKSARIQPEIAAAIHEALLNELEKAKAEASIKALREFEKKYPDHGLTAEFGAAVHEAYQRELNAYFARNPARDKAFHAYITKLFAFAEKAGPRVEVRMRRRASRTLGAADKVVAKSMVFNGEVSYPWHYFDDAHSEKREAAFVSALSEGLSKIFPPEALAFVAGPVLDDPPVDPKVPTIAVTYSAEWTTTTAISKRPRGIFVGITFPLDVILQLPTDAKAYRYHNDVWRTPMTTGLAEDLKPGQVETVVYDAIAKEAMDSFASKIVSLFGKPPK